MKPMLFTIKEATLIAQEYNQAYGTDIALHLRDDGPDWRISGQEGNVALHVRREAIRAMPIWAGYYYMYKHLCLAHQTVRPTDFDAVVRQSALYRILPNGQCQRRVATQWRTVDMVQICVLSTLQWQAAASNLPHEAYARAFAVEQAFDCLTNDLDRDNLHTLAYWDGAKGQFSVAQYQTLWRQIDSALGLSVCP